MIRCLLSIHCSLSDLFSLNHFNISCFRLFNSRYNANYNVFLVPFSPLFSPLLHTFLSNFFSLLLFFELFLRTLSRFWLSRCRSWRLLSFLYFIGFFVPILGCMIYSCRLRGLLVCLLLLLLVLTRLRSNDKSLFGVRDNLKLRLLNTVAMDGWDQRACVVLGVGRLGDIDFSFNVWNVVSNVLGCHLNHHINISTFLRSRSWWSLWRWGSLSLFNLFIDPFLYDLRLFLPELLLFPLFLSLSPLYFVPLQLFSLFLPFEMSLLQFPCLFLLHLPLFDLFLFFLLHLLDPCEVLGLLNSSPFPVLFGLLQLLPRLFLYLLLLSSFLLLLLSNLLVSFLLQIIHLLQL